jgi:ketosteroid isomerase-like protein
MNKRDPKLIVLQFNECINNQDLEGLSDLMTEDHTFIDSKGEIDRGKDTMLKGWRDFFREFPDYLNHFQRVESRDNLVLITGYSTCSYEPLDGPAIWTAKVDNDLVSEWRVYDDTDENREKLKL